VLPNPAIQQELRGKLLAEAESSAAANAEVAVRWGAVLGLDVPQELFQAIEEQRMACEAVIASKDRLIAGAATQTPAILHTVARAQQLCMAVCVMVQPAGVPCKGYVQPWVSKQQFSPARHKRWLRVGQQHSKHDNRYGNALPSDAIMKVALHGA
jgi:hypothetical protein